MSPLATRPQPLRRPRPRHLLSRWRQIRPAQWICWGSWGNLALIVLIWLLLWEVSESWWVGTVLTYLPRSPYLLPAVVLSAAAIRWHRLSLVPNLLAGLIVLGPVMSFNTAGLLSGTSAIPREALTIVSCNVQSYEPDFPAVIQEISRIDPDIIAFQEAFDSHPLLEPYFARRQILQVDEYLFAAKYPIRHIATCTSPAWDRSSAVCIAVETPHGEVRLFNIHQTSPRPALTAIRPWSLLGGEGISELEIQTVLLHEEAGVTRLFVEEQAGDRPAIVVGDFNMPADSSTFRTHWGDLTDAFQSTSWGYGYTSPCQTHKIWPSGWPWLQVDHILTQGPVTPLRCQIGRSNGSDHRLIAAWLQIEAAPAP